MNGATVAKFGGTSGAEASQFRKIAAIVRADETIHYVVISAPGKRDAADIKITDWLRELCRETDVARAGLIFEVIARRFLDIIRELGLTFDPADCLNAIWQARAQPDQFDFVVSRGEYLSARILAELLGYTFVDAADLIKFDSRGRLDMRAVKKCRMRLMGGTGRYVIPGYYGSLPCGTIKTFSRGGSDLSGAVVAALVNAGRYDKWTDTSGMGLVDPRLIADAVKVPMMTYKQLRELTYRGAEILHDEVTFPLRKAGIPIRIRNTNEPSDNGTLIVPELLESAKKGTIVGIAGRKGFSIITIEKAQMNQELGFIRRVCRVFEENAISIEHIPGGIDTISVVVANEALKGEELDHIVRTLQGRCRPDRVQTRSEIALICVVGHSLTSTPRVAEKIFRALARRHIAPQVIDQGSSEISIVIGVEDRKYETAVRAIYAAFVK